MKTELTVTIDEELILEVERLARDKGILLSQLVEDSLRTATQHLGSTFSQRWRGQFKACSIADSRGQA